MAAKKTTEDGKESSRIQLFPVAHVEMLIQRSFKARAELSQGRLKVHFLGSFVQSLLVVLGN